MKERNFSDTVAGACGLSGNPHNAQFSFLARFLIGEFT